jgi:Tol biopolymer transport system component
VTKPGAPKVDYVIDLNNGEKTPLPEAIIRSRGTADERSLHASWASQYAASHDGSQLAYVGTGNDGNPQIFVAGIDGTGVRQVTHDSRAATSPAWSPDGTRIAYIGYGAGTVRNFFLLDVAARESTQITDGSRDVWDSQFTPDGSSLVFTEGPDCCPVLRTVPVVGGKSVILIRPEDGLQDSGQGSLSPDGSLVTFLGGGFPIAGGGHCGPWRLVAKRWRSRGSPPRRTRRG